MHQRRAILISSQFVEYFLSSYIFGNTNQTLSPDDFPFKENLDLIQQISAQTTDAEISKELKIISKYFEQLLATDAEISEWIRQEYNASPSTFSKQDIEPIWRKSPKYQEFLAASISAMDEYMKSLENAFKRLKTLRAELGLHLENRQEEQVLERFSSIRLLKRNMSHE